MRKKLLSVVLALAMVLSLMPMAWAENGTETVTEPANPAADKAVTLTQGDTVQQFDTLQAAIDAVQAYDYSTNKEPYEITLNQNLTESVEIPAQRLKLTIDLNGCKLTNSDHHTITNKSTYGITITDSQGGGIVDNVSHGKAAIYNDINAKITLSGGTYMRSAEASTGDSASGGNSYYVIKNFGSMTISSGVTVKFSDTNQGLYSSLIGNGWQNAADAEAGTNGEPKPSEGKNKATLTINNGTFTGGQITVKNDDFGVLTIKDGTFKQSGDGRSAVANNHIATISGGTFDSTTGPAVYSRHYDGEANDGTLTISGGTFTSTGSHAVALLTSGAKADITGGTFDAGAGSYGVSGVEGASAQISAGTYKVDDAEKICNLPNALVPSYGAVQGEDGNFTVQVTDGEAVVIENGVTTQYPTLKAAMAAVQTGGIVQLRRDVTLEKGVETGSVSGITLDLNGYSIDGTAVKNANGVIFMQAKYGWKPVEGIDPTMKIINSVSGQGGEIKGTLPVQFGSGDSRYTIPGVIGEGVTLTVTGDGTDAVKLKSSAYLVYSEITKDYIKNGGFKITADDGTERIYGDYANAAGKAADGVVTMLHDYTGNDSIASGTSSGTLDLNGNTFTSLSSDQMVQINYDNAGITIRNGTLTGTAEALSKGGLTALYNNTTLVLENVIMNVPGDSYGIVTNSTNTGNSVTLKNSTLNVPDGLGIYFPSDGNVTIENSKINAKHVGVQMCAGSLTVTGDQTAITTTGTKQQKTEGDGPIVDGAAISIVKRDGYKDLGKVEIRAGAFKSAQADAVKAYTFNNTDKTEGAWDEANTVVKISGGLFSSDPTAYLAEGKMAFPITQGDYSFEVKDAIASVEIADGKADTQPAEGEYPADAVTEEAATAAAESVTASLAGAAGSVASGVDSAVVADAESKLGSKKPVGEETVVLVQPYPEVTPAGSSVDGDKKTVTFNIVPKYNLIATHTGVTVTTPDALDETNSVVLKKAQPLTVTTPAEVTLTLPEGFAAAGADVYIKHEASNGKTYYYTAKVAGDRTITFTTSHGFSPFTISTVNEAAAEVNGVGYPTLQEAVDAVENNGTIKLLKNIDAAEVATVSKDITFTVDTDGKTFDKDTNIVAGSNTTVKISGNATSYTYIFDYTAPSSGGGSSSATYTVNVEKSKHGSVESNRSRASSGTTVTLTVQPDKGYELDELTVTDKDGDELKLTRKSDTKYTFTMPRSAVTVEAVFVEEREDTGYSDVSADAWYADAVQYVTDKGMMQGNNGKFMPADKLNRGQMAQVLFNLEGKQPVNYAMSFGDVNGSEWFAEAVRWAASEKIVSGYDNGNFGPNDPITREQLAVILFRYAQYKGMDTVTLEENLTGFADADEISGYAVSALNWAVGAGVLKGTGTGLAPKANATRSEVAQMLMNFDQNVAK